VRIVTVDASWRSILERAESGTCLFLLVESSCGAPLPHANMEEVLKVLSVSGKCIETFPCRHAVSFLDAYGCTREAVVFGVEIIKRLREGKWSPEKPSEGTQFERYQTLLDSRDL
jgi:hypothetical protein